MRQQTDPCSSDKSGTTSAETNQSGNERASKKDKFDLSMGMLKEYYNALESRIEKTIALLLVLVGWLITSDAARNSLKNDPVILWGTIVTLTLLIIFLTGNLYHFLRKLISIRVRAAKLVYVSPKYFSRYEMKKWYLLIYLAPVLVLYGFILLLLF